MKRVVVAGMSILISLLGVNAEAAVTSCPISSMGCVITITVNTSNCPSNVCTLTTSPSSDVLVTSGTPVRWQMPTGTTNSSFTVFFLPDSQNQIFSVNPIFSAVVGGAATGDVATASSGFIAIATYFIFWTDGTRRAYLDPRVVVNGNTADSASKALKAVIPN